MVVSLNSRLESNKGEKKKEEKILLAEMNNANVTLCPGG